MNEQDPRGAVHRLRGVSGPWRGFVPPLPCAAVGPGFVHDTNFHYDNSFKTWAGASRVVCLTSAPFTDVRAGMVYRGNQLWVKVENLDLVHDLTAHVGKTSQHFCSAEQRQVEILVEPLKKVRYQVGAIGERASRTESTLITGPTGGSPAPIIVAIKAGDVLHLVSDATEAGMVAVQLAFRVF